MSKHFSKPRIFSWLLISLLLIFAALLSGCSLFELDQDFTPEPAAQGPASGEQGALSTVEPRPTRSPAVIENTPTTDTGSDQTSTPIPTPTETNATLPDAPPTNSPTPPNPPTPIPITWTPTAAPPPGPIPSPTPVAPLQGMVISDDNGLWWITGGPVILTTRPDAVLSPNGQHLMFTQDDDIWIQNIATGEERNLTGESGRTNCCALWWAEQPDTIIFGSWPIGEDIGPTSGFLTSVNINTGEYQVLDEEIQSNALAGPGPDGVTIAYDRGGTSWFYHAENGIQPLDPAAFGLQNIVRIGGPAWSPDGQQIAWTVAVTDPDWRIALALFDLPSGTARLLHPYENAGRGGWFPPPVWSPDGRWLAFVAEDILPDARGVWLVAVDGSQETYLGPGWNPVWSPNGLYLAYNAISDLDTGQFIPTLAVAESAYQLPLALAPGSRIMQWIEPN